MADPAQIVAKARSYGANVMLDGQKLVVVNKEKLPAGALDFIRNHAAQIGVHLANEAEFEERAAIMEFDGGLTRQGAEYLARLLHSSPPKDTAPADWSWFVGEAVKIIDRDMQRAAA